MRAQEFKYLAAKLRYELIAMIANAGSGHSGGSLSIVDMLTALYFGGVMKFDPKDPAMPNRDRLLLAKGHASPALYVVLAETGFFPKEWLKEFDASGSRLPKHCDRLRTPGIEASTGALGQGLSVAVGMALAERLDKESAYRVYCIVGDGDCMSGNHWEAVMSAAKYKLDNLAVLVDENGLTVDGFTDDVMPLGKLTEKWQAFGWHTIECDGHDIADILRALEEIGNLKGKPGVIVAHTVKGKGVSFMENVASWHSAKIQPDLAKQALAELKAGLDKARRDMGGSWPKEEHGAIGVET